MRILVTGRTGQVGWELERVLQPLGEVVAVDRAELDLDQPATVASKLDRIRPDLIVNAAAYTAVDKAESDPDAARRVNAESPGKMAQWAARHGAALIHYSTDYVFDGRLERPYSESDATEPLSVYGRTKLEGEDAIRSTGCPHLILRTSWVYGARGRNFLRTIIRLARERDELRIVDDQFGAPTWCRAIAEATAAVVARAGKGDLATALQLGGGVVNLACRGSTTWHGFARAALAHFGTRFGHVRVVPITTEQYPTPARRPRNSRLSGQRLSEQWGMQLPDWQDALALCLAGADPDSL